MSYPCLRTLLLYQFVDVTERERELHSPVTVVIFYLNIGNSQDEHKEAGETGSR